MNFWKIDHSSWLHQILSVQISAKDDNVTNVRHNISSSLNQQKISDNSVVADKTSGAKKTPLNESNILDGNFKVAFPQPVTDMLFCAQCTCTYTVADTKQLDMQKAFTYASFYNTMSRDATTLGK